MTAQDVLVPVLVIAFAIGLLVLRSHRAKKQSMTAGACAKCESHTRT